MPNGEKKGITVKIDADLHAEIRQYLEEHEMTMAEFVAQALDNELHPQYQMKEQNNMRNMRTIAFQVPEDLYQKIKDYIKKEYDMTVSSLYIAQVKQKYGIIERDCYNKPKNE